MSAAKHTCSTAGRSSCALCMELETDLWDAIHRYVIACGGDPGAHVHGNTPRMQAVVDVGKVVARVGARQPIDASSIGSLVREHDAISELPRETGPAYETARQLAQLWRDQRTASFDLLDRLVTHFAPRGDT